LLNTLDLVSLLGYLNSAGQLSGSSTTNHIIVLDHVSDNTQSIMETSLSLIADGLAATSDQNGDCLAAGTVLNQDDFVLRGTESDFLNASSFT
jgi:hypothetical protein